MNPLVKDILDTAHSHDIELRFLEDLFADDCKCESRAHLVECTKVATHRSKNCQRSANICEDATNYVLDGLMSPDNCEDCKLPCSECWTITPI